VLKRTSNLLTNLHALGLDNFLDDLCVVPSVNASLSVPSWSLKHRSSIELAPRLTGISALAFAGHCEAAYKLLCDLPSTTKPRDVGLTDRQKNLLAMRQQPKAQRLRSFTEWLCIAQNLLHAEYRFAVQNGKMVLRELMKLESDTEAVLDRHAMVFEAIAAHCQYKRARNAAITELLDFPRAARAALLLNPEARQLLWMVDPDIAKVFDAVERNASDVFDDRLQRLQQEGFTFDGITFGDEPVEIIDGGVVESASVDLLLELAEAAVHCTGYVNWVTGVLQFLSERVLEDHQIARAAELRDLVQLAVRFHPDHEVSRQFETIRSLTDSAIREMHGNPGD
jgi:hypothetical protein